MKTTYPIMPTHKPTTPALPPAPHITVAKNLQQIDYDECVQNGPHFYLMRTLRDMLTKQRNHGSTGEMEAFTALVSEMFTQYRCFIDGAGNLHVDTRYLASHRTLFTAHTDTCHRNSGNEDNPVFVDTDNGDVIWRSAPGLCLGADDGAGVALLVHLIHPGVPGYFIFFRGEERGGVGSSWLAEHMPDLLKQFDRAVAFDRAGYSDVITHQGRGRCCSDEFGNALALALTPDDFSLAYTSDDTGVYTDTAEFIDIIPECTNVSVGYHSQHGDREWLNVSFLCRLADQIRKVKWDELPVKRDPKVKEPRWPSYGQYKNDIDWASWVRVPDSFNSSPVFDTSDPDAEMLAEELDKAAETGSHLNLMKVIAELVYPDDPQMAHRNMTKRLKTSDIDDAYNELACGADPITVAEQLYQLVSRT